MKEPTDEEVEASEQKWLDGNRAAWVRMLSECLRELGYDSGEAGAHRYILEREAALAQLRMLCEYFGDNEWDETLHLADVIDKHLGRHLHDSEDD